ncbi:pentatricopeptide repeat-containing protein At3g06430, chloroplastic-like [Phalaenopsis equestris]|uniref:pentatricopeptide repeat-containing protein At3g06430, chloroplastic-like n=1 Tax=Phalaenopsis equestris TaxID=78828 RepID=UPI0009E470CD|nr:pentatricopeptide repeat-containing protein At3g06430, chloroplastic-like [Phalaenopsis equestris]
MATASSISFSSSFLPFPWRDGKIAEVRPVRICLCALRSRPKKKSSSSSMSPPRVSSTPQKTPAAPAPNAPHSPPKKRHWKAGEFPGVSESSIVGSLRPPIKNIKKKIDDRRGAKAWACTVTEALSDRIQKKQWREALEVFEMLRAQSFYRPKEGTFMKLIVLLGKSGQAVSAGELFEIMLEEGIEPTSALYTALLAAFCRCNFIDEAFSILTKMKTLPLCQPDIFTYSTLLKACIESSRFELIDSLYQDMSERMIVPNTVTQNIVLGGYGKAGKFIEMEKVLTAMLESDTCRPDVWTMNIILGLFGTKGEIEMMEKWYENFRNIGIEPETRTLNILISAYGRNKMYDKMTSVMEYMRKLAFPWTTSTYNNIIEAFASVGDAKSIEYAFVQMQAEGMKADTNTFRYLITGYSNAGLFQKVVSSIKLAERSEIPHNTSFLNAVIYACSKAGDLIEMERVFKSMKERRYMPDSTTYSILVEAYRKEGMNNKINDLEREEGRSFGIELVAE